MMHTQRKLVRGLEVLEYYFENDFDFDNENCAALFKLVNKVEMDKYYVGTHETSHEDIVNATKTNVKGIRRYLLNEPDETLPASKRLLKM